MGFAVGNPLLFTVFGFAGSSVLASIASITTCRFDLEVGNFIIKQRSLFRSEVVEHRLSEIQDVEIENNGDNEDKSYQVGSFC